MNSDLVKIVYESQTENDAVDRLSLEEISRIDVEKLLKLRFLNYKDKVNYNWVPGYRFLVDENDVVRYCEERFTPRKNSIYLKPSFAGR